MGSLGASDGRWSDVPAIGWAAFGGLLGVLLVIDLVAHRGRHGDSHRSAITWTVVWIAAGLLFGGFVWAWLGGAAAQEYLAAWLIEKSLSVDNLFVFLVIFASLKIPDAQQRVVLLWGIFGALVFRAIFVFAGARAIERWDWVPLLFAALLLFAAVRVMLEHPADKEESRTVKWLSKRLPFTQLVHGKCFFVVESGHRVATPLLIALVSVEITDIMFAIDSVPAAFSVTMDPFIIYSSNAFAILGLRALYIVLAKTIAELEYLHYGLGAVLVFASFKFLTGRWLHVPPWLSIGIIAACIAAATWASLRARRLGLVRRSRRPKGDDGRRIRQRA